MAQDAQNKPSHPEEQMSIEAYLNLNRSARGAKYEYVDGVAKLMSGGSVAHARIARNTANAIDEHFTSGPCSVHSSDMQVLLGSKANGKRHYCYPDVTLTCEVSDRRRGNTLIESPRIVVEVLSPSTEPDDRGKKLRAYKDCPTIQDIVLISQFSRHVETYHHDEEDETKWHYIVYDEERPEVMLTSVDISITLDEIYKGIDFDEPVE